MLRHLNVKFWESANESSELKWEPVLNPTSAYSPLYVQYLCFNWSFSSSIWTSTPIFSAFSYHSHLKSVFPGECGFERHFKSLVFAKPSRFIFVGDYVKE